MVINEQSVITGSMHFAEPASENNDGSSFVLGGPYDLMVDRDGLADHLGCWPLVSFFCDQVDRIVPATSASIPERRFA